MQHIFIFIPDGGEVLKNAISASYSDSGLKRSIRDQSHPIKTNCPII